MHTHAVANVKQYRIVCCDMQWQLKVDGQDCGLLQSDDRSYLVQIACRVAAERDCAVHVFDQCDALEARLWFQNGVLSVDGCYRGDLDLAGLGSGETAGSGFADSK